MSVADNTTIEAARSLVARSERIVVLTGAGISTDSGIADYRGPNGLWTKNPKAERTSNIQYYLSDPEVRRLAWQHRVGSPIWDAQPNAGHLALVELERQGRLDTLVTQNVDGLHQRAGSDPSRVIEIHGAARTVVCWDCGDSAPMERALERVRAGEDDPDCRSCGGILKSATISFGQQLVADDLERASEAARRADLVMAVGSTLGVYPAAGLIPAALNNGARLIILNADPTRFDPQADVVLHASISEVLPEIVRDGPRLRPDGGPG
ncbi:MAG: NAD-dependent deacylase [Actinomycetota bacterium]|nr:NAD-dependent deacylase [Actinomycetota bacterium]